MHALIALDVNDTARAYQFFLASVRIDLDDLYGNTPDGMHAACLGGVWQIIVHGFGGVRVHRGGILSFNPRLPAAWGSLKFKVKWKGTEMKIAVFERDVEIFFASRRVRSIKAIVFKRLKTVYANRVNCFKRNKENA